MRPVMATVTCIFYATNDVKDDKRLYTDGKMNLMTVSIMCYVIQNCIQLTLELKNSKNSQLTIIYEEIRESDKEDLIY